MILDSLLAGMMLFSSFAMRTPNVQPNPDDYEVSIGFNNSNYYFNRQWERELGKTYIDDIIWFLYDKNSLYLKPEYFNKQSKGVTYLKLDYRYVIKETGWSYGLTTRTIDGTDVSGGWETLYSLGYRKVKETDNVAIEVSFNGYYGESFEYEDIFKVSYKLTKNIRLYNSGEFYKLKQVSSVYNVTFYKAKIGLEYIF
jgi:hypothetical protein